MVEIALGPELSLSPKHRETVMDATSREETVGDIWLPADPCMSGSGRSNKHRHG
jgi:hypothetical protein